MDSLKQINVFMIVAASVAMLGASKAVMNGLITANLSQFGIGILAMAFFVYMIYKIYQNKRIFGESRNGKK